MQLHGAVEKRRADLILKHLTINIHLGHKYLNSNQEIRKETSELCRMNDNFNWRIIFLLSPENTKVKVKQDSEQINNIDHLIVERIQHGSSIKIKPILRMHIDEITMIWYFLNAALRDTNSIV